ncbi:MBL fold metallo-hydrolase [Chondromyces apiculatus]|uniref:Putative cAMP phosphodiesterases class-II n=1 Tax=Chondromyces apiculatus DSM 436 TaxID=1192034 RepID=A0A017T6F6_9BACT|nr:3',5'-cyclic-nucleotide phosphodiesterase [Chondromyces apiculatus]EYF04814.1 putative cAMP phosphodiesterases class-II [Chondromyces apiculatus DSM 436]
MELRVIGCHGGETPKHRTCAFVLDDVLSIDAGSLTSGLEVGDQARLQACLVSHAHLDHIRDLATIADNRCQMGCAPLIVAGTRGTLRALQQHFFNNMVWPDFAVIPNRTNPTIRYLELEPEQPTMIAGHRVRAVSVTHTIEASGFVVEGDDGAIGYSGDTGPTDRLWEVLNEQKNLRALLMEVSFPNREQGLATISGHHTPRTLGIDLRKYRAPQDLPTLLYHIKPVFQSEVERECAALRGLNMQVVQLLDHFVL